MDLRGKIKIRPKGTKSFPIEVREKIYYSCKGCSNRYTDPYYFCPQCLGHLVSPAAAGSQLRILKIPENRIKEIPHLIQSLSGKKEFPLEKSLQSLPWIMIKRSDEGVLHHWMDVLNAEKVEVVIESATIEPSKKKGLFKPKKALFETRAPLPAFFTPVTDSLIRTTARSIQNPSLRLRWIEVTLQAFRMMEWFYKKDPSLRILFADYLFQIDHEFHEAAKEFDTLYKGREESFEKIVDRLRGCFSSMEEDILAVKKQVQESL